MPLLRRAFPKAEILIRLDASFTGAKLYDFFEKERFKYVVCMAKNSVLQTLCELTLPKRNVSLGRHLTLVHRPIHA